MVWMVSWEEKMWISEDLVNSICVSNYITWESHLTSF